MTQRHNHGLAIIQMARRDDCIGLSGFNSFHNSQYFRLFGRDVAAGDRLSTTVRLEVVDLLGQTPEDDAGGLDRLALERYEAWSGR